MEHVKSNNNVRNYVLCVDFDGKIIRIKISME